jgi:hypothetical protein
MTAPSRGSRRVLFDGVPYRWRIRKQPTYTQAVDKTFMRLSVCRDAPDARSVLMVNLRVTRPDNWLAPHQTAVKPAMVREMIARALAAGWAPESDGSPFLLDYPLIRDHA